MRTTRTTRVAAALGLAAALTVTACGQGSGGSASSGASGSSGSSGGKSYTVAFVPKLQGIPYFEAMNTGGKRACDEIGCTWLYQGPVQADPAAQADIVRSYIQQHVDALIVAPNDPDSMAPLLKQASDAGIKVATSDTDAPNSVRQVFVSQASTEGIGQALTDSLMKAMGGGGKYAIVSCGPAAANLNAWISVQKEYSAARYPKAELVETVYAGEDQDHAKSMATDLMTRHPDLTGLVGECTTSAPAVAQAVRDRQKIGQVFTVGVGTPQSIKPFLLDGSCSESVLWNVESLGWLTAWTAKQVADGKPLSAFNKVSLELPAVKYDAASKTVLLGDPLLITADNVDQFKY